MLFGRSAYRMLKVSERWPIITKGLGIVLLLAVGHWWSGTLSLLGIQASPSANITGILEIVHFCLPVIIAAVLLWALWDLYRVFLNQR